MIHNRWHCLCAARTSQPHEKITQNWFRLKPQRPSVVGWFRSQVLSPWHGHTHTHTHIISFVVVFVYVTEVRPATTMMTYLINYWFRTVDLMWTLVLAGGVILLVCARTIHSSSGQTQEDWRIWFHLVLDICVNRNSSLNAPIQCRFLISFVHEGITPRSLACRSLIKNSVTMCSFTLSVRIFCYFLSFCPQNVIIWRGGKKYADKKLSFYERVLDSDECV